MAITPDTKDWTWVLERTCPECGFDVRTFPRHEVGSMIRDNATGWGPVLAHPQVRLRPADDTWSALEYACHVRDVYRLYDDRLRLILEEDDPDFPNWDQDAAAIESGYSAQDPENVSRELSDAAERLAERFDGLHEDHWVRTGNRSDGARFTTETFARYLIHDPFHHLHDVERGFERLSDS